jgi:hypothetical protein
MSAVRGRAEVIDVRSIRRVCPQADVAARPSARVSAPQTETLPIFNDCCFLDRLTAAYLRAGDSYGADGFADRDGFRLCSPMPRAGGHDLAGEEP